MNIFFSYSTKDDKDVIEKVENFFVKNGIKLIIDKEEVKFVDFRFIYIIRGVILC